MPFTVPAPVRAAPGRIASSGPVGSHARAIREEVGTLDKTKQIQVAMVVVAVIGVVLGFVLGGWLWAFVGLVVGWLLGAGLGALWVRR